jgi:hypothetical protein
LNGLIAASGIWGMDKLIALSSHTKHRNVPSPISQHFVAPLPAANLTFGPIALAAAVARTATTRDDAPAELLDGLQRSALIELQTLIEDGHSFKLKPYFQFLADTHRSQLAAKTGAGITDLYMNALGYTWRANANCLSSALDPHADFIYDGGNATGLGVVLAEAHGSFAATVSSTGIRNQAKRKYIRQVKPYIARTSPFGKVIHGYSVAFGCAPGTTGGFLSLSETKITRPRGKRRPPPPASYDDRPSMVPTPIVLSTHRSNFLLIGALEVVNWIDWIRLRDGSTPEPEQVAFIRLQHAGRSYLTSAPWSWRSSSSPWWAEDFFWRSTLWDHLLGLRRLTSSSHDPHFGWFVIDEKAGKEFLTSLTGIIASGEYAIPPTLQLPILQPVGFGLLSDDAPAARREDGEYRYALFRDGLALLGDPFRGRVLDIVTWSPYEGLLR